MTDRRLLICGTFDVQYLKDGDHPFYMDCEDALALLEILKSIEGSELVTWIILRLEQFIKRNFA